MFVWIISDRCSGKINFYNNIQHIKNSVVLKNLFVLAYWLRESLWPFFFCLLVMVYYSIIPNFEAYLFSTTFNFEICLFFFLFLFLFFV